MLSARAHVYAMPRADGAIKIGHSSDLARRLYQIRAQGIDAQPAVYWLDRLRPEAHAIELLAHWLVRQHRVDGEWFRIPRQEAIEVINSAALRFDNGERAPKWSEDPANAKGRIALLVDGAQAARLEKWRCEQAEYVPASTAVCTLIALALDLEEAKRLHKGLTPETNSGDMRGSSGSRPRVATGGSPRQQ